MASSWQRLRKGASFYAPRIALGLIVLASLYQTLCHTEAFADDAAISFSYSRQLAEAGELVHTASSERVEGFSNPTWTVLCALPFLLRMDPYIFARAVGVMCLLATIMLVFRATRLLCPRAGAARYVAALFVSMAPCVCFWTLAGLETPLVFFLLAAAFDQAVREEEQSTGRHYSGVYLGLLALTRPEGIIYAAPFFLYKLVRLLQTPRDERRAALARHAANLGWLLVIVGSYLVWRRLYFGDWLPNTFYAKVAAVQLLLPDAGGDSRGRLYIEGFFELYSLWPLIYAAPLALLVRRRWPEALLLGVIAGMHLGFVYAVEGDWMGDFRFFAMVMPAYALILGMVTQGASDLLTRLGTWLRRPRIGEVVGRLGAAALAVTFVVVSLLPTLAAYERSGWVRMELVRQQGTSLEMLARRSGLLRATIAVPDVGGSALFSNLGVLDTVGLVDPVVGRHKGRPARIRQYVLEEARPDFYQQHSHWRRYYNLPLHFEFRRDYVRLPDPLTKRLVMLGENYVRREHLTGFLREAQHRTDVELGRGLVLRGYDDPIVTRRHLLIRLFVETNGEQPRGGEQLSVRLRSDAENPRTGHVDLAMLPDDLFEAGSLLRFNVPVRSGPVDGIQVSGPLDEGSDWLDVSTVVTGRADGADLARFVLFPRTHFACVVPSWRGREPFTVRGRLQQFDGCLPLHGAGEVARLAQELRRRARAAGEAGHVRAAIVLLNRAELLEPESPLTRRMQRRAARAALRQARRAADRGDLEAARALAVAALGADTTLSPARVLYHQLIRRGLRYSPDARERAETASVRALRGRPAPATARELLAAQLAADRPLAAARIMEEIGLAPEGDRELALLAAHTYLSLGLCERVAELFDTAAGGEPGAEACESQWLRYQASVMCATAAASPESPPTCARQPLPLGTAARRSVFELEGDELARWETSEALVDPGGRIEHYVSGYTGTGLIRTDWVAGGVRGSYRALSPEFEITASALSLQIGGGIEEDGVRAVLLIDGREVHRAAGRRDHHLRRVTWDVSEHRGRRARIRVEDAGDGEWGLLYVDHVRQHPLYFFEPDRAPVTRTHGRSQTHTD